MIEKLLRSNKFRNFFDWFLFSFQKLVDNTINRLLEVVQT